MYVSCMLNSYPIIMLTKVDEKLTKSDNSMENFIR